MRNLTGRIRRIIGPGLTYSFCRHCNDNTPTVEARCGWCGRFR